MRIILGLVAVAAASTSFGANPTSIVAPDHVGGPGHGGPPNFLISGSDCENRTWTDGLGRPTNSQPFNRSPSITTSNSPSTVIEHPSINAPYPGSVSISTVFLTSIITLIDTVSPTCPASIGTTVAVERTVPAPTTICKPHTITEIPSPACYSSGTSPTADAAVCNGKDCEITFEKGAIVHWEPLTSRTPLVTHYLQSTCVSVVCNTTKFSLYYSRSVTSCDRPPCPSNSLNCECNIVVGPFNLPDGKVTSVTQTGPSGWNLNLGPAATVHNIGHCGPNGPVCEVSATTLFTPLVYTDDVKAVGFSSWSNHSRAEATAFLLPQLTDYFPAGDPLGLCTNIKLSLPSTITLTKWKRDDVATVGGDGVTTWPGCETLTDDSNAKRGVMARQTLSDDTTQLPICSSEDKTSTTTVTVAPQASGSAVETQGRSAAAGREVPFWGTLWFLPLVMLVVL